MLWLGWIAVEVVLAFDATTDRGVLTCGWGRLTVEIVVAFGVTADCGVLSCAVVPKCNGGRIDSGEKVSFPRAAINPRFILLLLLLLLNSSSPLADLLARKRPIQTSLNAEKMGRQRRVGIE